MSEPTPSTPPQNAAEASIDPRLLEILVCPATRTKLVWNRETNELVSRAAGLAYPVRDGVPILLVDEARELNEAG
jgi:uncharacterized protein